jgi:hypothetical protein
MQFVVKLWRHAPGKLILAASGRDLTNFTLISPTKRFITGLLERKLARLRFRILEGGLGGLEGSGWGVLSRKVYNGIGLCRIWRVGERVVESVGIRVDLETGRFYSSPSISSPIPLDSVPSHITNFLSAECFLHGFPAGS